MKNISSLQNIECKTQNTKCKKYLLSAGSWRQSCFWLQREQVLHTEAPARNQNGALVKTHPISLEIKIPVGRIPWLQVVIFSQGIWGGRLLVDCPTQLTLYDLDLSVMFHDKLPVRNMREHSREIC